MTGFAKRSYLVDRTTPAGNVDTGDRKGIAGGSAHRGFDRTTGARSDSGCDPSPGRKGRDEE